MRSFFVDRRGTTLNYVRSSRNDVRFHLLTRRNAHSEPSQLRTACVNVPSWMELQARRFQRGILLQIGFRSRCANELPQASSKRPAHGGCLEFCMTPAAAAASVAKICASRLRETSARRTVAASPARTLLKCCALLSEAQLFRILHQASWHR